MGFLSQERVDEIEAALAGTSVPSSTKVLRGAEMFVGEATDYPRSLADFVGQEAAKEQLEVVIASARARGARLDHTLFAAGEPGIGKTTLAYLATYLMGVGIAPTTGKGLNVNGFRDLVMACEDGDVVFVDEVHLAVEGNRTRSDWLLPWMLGNGLNTGRGVQKTPDVTLLAATTDAGKLPMTMLSRFMNTPELAGYTPAEGARLVANLAPRVGVELDEKWLGPVAQAADNNPRTIRKVLFKIRDLYQVRPEGHPNLDKALTYAGVTADGLTNTARDILIVLASKPDHTCSIESLGHELGEPGPLAHHERTLLRRGYVEVTGRGRHLTRSGLARAMEVFNR
jgi:Holliday junction DNA helicase RuvB